MNATATPQNCFYAKAHIILCLPSLAMKCWSQTQFLDVFSLYVYSPHGDSFNVFFFFSPCMYSWWLLSFYLQIVSSGFHTYTQYSLNFSPWMSDIHLELHISKFKFLCFVLSKLACLVVFCVLVSGNSVLLAALYKTLRPSSAPCALYLLHQQILLVPTLRYI